jgi:hypothetical protein
MVIYVLLYQPIKSITSQQINLRDKEAEIKFICLHTESVKTNVFWFPCLGYNNIR